MRVRHSGAKARAGSAALTVMSLVMAGPAVVLATPTRATAVERQCPEWRDTAALAQLAAVMCSGQVEIMAERTETTKVFALPNGQRRAQIHTGPVRVRDQQGTWRDIDLTLVERPDGSVAPRVHYRNLVLAGAAGEGDHTLADMGTGENRLVLGWTGRLPKPVLAGSMATWPEVKPGVDLQVQVTTSGFEYFLVVKDRSAAGQLATVRMPVRAGTGLGRLKSSKAGKATELQDGGGAVRARLGTPMMWDARTNPKSGDPARVRPVGVTVTPNSMGADLVVTPDEAFLQDPATTYPVTIDPHFEPPQPNLDTFVESDYPDSMYYNYNQLRLGTYDGGWTQAQTYLRWDTSPSIYGASITYAKLYLWNYWSYSCTDAEWQMYVVGYPEYNITWNTRLDLLRYDSNSSQTAGNENCGSSDSWVEINATDWFQTVADSYYPYYGMALLGANDWWDSNSWKKFNSNEAGWNQPFVDVWYSFPPTVQAVDTSPTMACVTGAGRPHLSSIPTFKAQISDPEGENVKARFEWARTDGTIIGSTQTGEAASGSWFTSKPPAADLGDGGSYMWHAQGGDPYRFGGWSPWCEFTVDAQPPTAVATSPPSLCMSTSTAADTSGLPRLNPNASGLTLKATITDINGGTSRADFEWWTKSARHSGGSAMGSATTSPPAAVPSTFQKTVPAGTFADGTAYSWRARGNDGGYTKPWSGWCEFVADSTAPAAPTATEDPGNELTFAAPPDTPVTPGGNAVVGRPTTVTFRPAGGTDANIVGYLWGVSDTGTPPTRWAPADSTGKAVVSIEPVAGGFATNQLTVQAVDRAGNRSPLPVPYSYGFKALEATGMWSTTGTAGPIQDLTVNDNDLTLGGSASLGYGSLSLNGATGEAVTAAPVIDTTDSFTVAAWVQPTSVTGNRTALSQDGGAESGFKLQYVAASNTWCFTVPVADISGSAAVSSCAAAGVAVNNAWVYLAGVYDANAQTIALYVNGTLVHTDPVADPWPAVGPFAVGRARGAGVPTERFAGNIAAPRAWQQVLDAAGIAALAKLPPAAGQWGMEDPAASAAADLSGLSAVHNAALSGNAGWLGGRAGGGSLALDGAGGSAATSGAVIRTDKSFTVSAWVYNTDTSTTSLRTALTQKGSTVNAFILQKRGNQWAFGRPASDSSSATIAWSMSSTTVAANTWVHLTGVYNANTNTVRLYVNGVASTATSCTCAWNSSGGMAVGKPILPGSTDWWRGRIDDLRVFQGALTDAQITVLAA